MVAELYIQPGYLGAGCTEACQRQRVRPFAVLHDPAAHEAYGHSQAIASLKRPVVRTGILTVRFADQRVLLNGDEEASLTKTEWAVLAVLAERPGCMIAYQEIVTRVWSEEHYATTRESSLHGLRVVIVRLRSALGAAAGLIETNDGCGMTLLDVPIGEPAPARFRRNSVPGRWALAFDSCQGCGTTERPHRGHGLCRRCQIRRDRRDDDGE